MTDERREVQRSTIAWVMKNLERFALPGAPDATLALKPLGELGMFGELVGRDPEWDPDARSALDFAWKALREGERLAEAMRVNTAYAAAYTLFYVRGYRNAAIESLLADATWLARVPRMPIQFPVEIVRRTVGLPPFWDLDELLVGTTVLPHHPTPGSLSDLLAYTMTHTVFHLTGYGKDPDAVAERDRAYLRESLPAWIEHYRRRGHVDLVAELAMTGHCIHTCHCSTDVWNLIRASQQADGAVRGAPGTVVRGREYPEIFLAVYHPTITSAMASAMCRA